MDEPACPGCRALQKLVAELQVQVAELTRRLDEALRAGNSYGDEAGGAPVDRS